MLSSSPQQPLLSDSEMRAALTRFMEAHPDLSAGPIQYVNEGVFTSVARMRTLTPLVAHCKHDRAATLELRGHWSYPVMMMDDCQLRSPDPPAILVLDRNGGVLARFRPRTAEDAEAILRDHVFDVANVERRKAELAAAELESERRAQKEAFLAKRRAELNVQLRTSVQSAVAKCNKDLRELARRLVEQLNAQPARVYADVDAYSEVATLHAFEGGLPQAVQAVSREVERLMHLELMGEASVPVAV
jgi:dsDNA-binding SOS-regulon protein